MKLGWRRNIGMSADILATVGTPIVFFTNDPKVGVGLEKIIPNYHIVCIDDSPIVDYLLQAGVKVFCYERQLGKRNILFRNSSQLLDQPSVINYLEESIPGREFAALMFKPGGNISKRLPGFKVHWLNNPSSLNRRFEDKVGFYREFYREVPFPKGEVLRLGEKDYGELTSAYGGKLVVQFGRGWAGNTTFFVNQEKEWDDLVAKYRGKETRVSKHLSGRTFINNVCVTAQGVLPSAPFSQITGIVGWTRYHGGTCGNDWGGISLEKNYADKIQKITIKIGGKMLQAGYRGIFGLDFLVDDTGEVFVLENNARLTASIPMYTKLELMQGRLSLLGYHLLEFLEQPLPAFPVGVDSLTGGQVLLRNVASNPQQVGGDLPMGVYTAGGPDQWQYIRPGYSIEDLKQVGEYLVLPASLGRVVNPDIEYLRLQSLVPVLNDKGQLQPEVYQLAEWARKKINLNDHEETQ